MAKQVSIGLLQEEVAIYDQFVEIPLDDNSEYVLKLYPFFKPEKVRDLVKEFAEFYKACKEAKIEIKKDEDDDLIGFFIVKYFTNIKFSRSKKTKKIYDEYKILINSSLFPVIMKAIPEESIKRIYDYIYEAVEAGEKLHALFESAQQHIKDLSLDSKDALFPNDEN